MSINQIKDVLASIIKDEHISAAERMQAITMLLQIGKEYPKSE